MDYDSSSKFIGSLAKFLQSLCNGFVEFDNGIEMIGHIYLSIDRGKKIDYVLNETVCRTNGNDVVFTSNSFQAQPAELPRFPLTEAIIIEDGLNSQDVISQMQIEPSTNAGSIPEISITNLRSLSSHNFDDPEGDWSPRSMESQNGYSLGVVSDEQDSFTPLDPLGDQSSRVANFPNESNFSQSSIQSLNADVITSNREESEESSFEPSRDNDTTFMKEIYTTSKSNHEDFSQISGSGATISKTEEGGYDVYIDNDATFIKQEFIPSPGLPEGGIPSLQEEETGMALEQSHEDVSTGELLNDGAPPGSHKYSSIQSWNSHLKGHIEMRTHPVDKSYECSTCFRAFTSSPLLQAHMRIHSGDKLDRQPTHPVVLPRSSRLKTKGSTCSTCDRVFTKSSTLKKHMKIHSGERVRPHKCSICDMAFTSKYNLIRHMRIHSGDKPHKCPTCDMTFTKISTLKKHMKIHPGERVKPYKCSTCDVAFTQRCHLVRHMRIHSGDKPHKCPKCDLAFICRSNLIRHMRIHSIKELKREKPHICSICDSTFTKNSILKKHMKIHSDEKPYICSTCDRAFTLSCTLKEHMKIHSGERVRPHRCSTCDMAFTYKSFLTRHMRIHSGDKPHKCPICDRAFTQRCHLDGHMTIHSGEKRYKCLTCDEAFSRMDKLKRHCMKIH